MSRHLSPTSQQLARAFSDGITANKARLAIAAVILDTIGDYRPGSLDRLADSDLVDDLTHLIHPDALKDTSP